MKKILSLLMSLVLLLSLCACGSKSATKELESAALAESLLKGNVFSGDLDELPVGAVTSFYQLSEESVADALLYHASGTNKEQIVIVRCSDEAAAVNAVSTLQGLVNGWIEADRDYAPQEVPKLEKAVLRQSGVWAVLVIANDPDAAAKIVGEYI